MNGQPLLSPAFQIQARGLGVTRRAASHTPQGVLKPFVRTPRQAQGGLLPMATSTETPTASPGRRAPATPCPSGPAASPLIHPHPALLCSPAPHPASDPMPGKRTWLWHPLCLCSTWSGPGGRGVAALPKRRRGSRHMGELIGSAVAV